MSKHVAQLKQLIDDALTVGHVLGSVPADVQAQLNTIGRTMAEEWVQKAGEDGRKLNRRVEFYFYYPDGTPLKSRFASPVIIEGE